VDFCQFMDGSWTKILSPSLAMIEVSSAIRNEAHETKNKVFKLQGAKMYLTLIFFFLIKCNKLLEGLQL
jgi:hypothetical protein